MTSPDAINLTVNVTKRCNTVCAHCNRGIGVVDWSDVRDFTREDARRTVDAVKASGLEVKKVKLSGGEPSIHPDIRGIVDILCEISSTIWVISNAIKPKSELCNLPQGARWKRDPINEKDHHPFFVSPTDLGLEDQIMPDLHKTCQSRMIAGQGVEPEGFTQCGLARTLMRALGRKDEGIYFDSPPMGETDYEICRHCPLSLGSKGNKALSLEVSRGKHKCPTKSFKGLHEPVKIMVKADSHLRRLAAQGLIAYDAETGSVVKLHQLETVK